MHFQPIYICLKSKIHLFRNCMSFVFHLFSTFSHGRWKNTFLWEILEVKWAYVQYLFLSSFFIVKVYLQLVPCDYKYLLKLWRNFLRQKLKKMRITDAHRQACEFESLWISRSNGEQRPQLFVDFPKLNISLRKFISANNIFVSRISILINRLSWYFNGYFIHLFKNFVKV